MGIEEIGACLDLFAQSVNHSVTVGLVTAIAVFIKIGDKIGLDQDTLFLHRIDTVCF